jgi:hypothetical protein
VIHRFYPSLVVPSVTILKDMRTSSSVRVPLQTTVIWAVLMLAGVGRAWGDFDTGHLATWLFLVSVALVAVTFLLYYLYMEFAHQER